MTEPAIPYVVPPLDVMKEVTALLNAGMKPDELNQLLGAMTKAMHNGANRFNLSWLREETPHEEIKK